jgi:hypothetical protein
LNNLNGLILCPYCPFSVTMKCLVFSEASAVCLSAKRLFLPSIHYTMS